MRNNGTGITRVASLAAITSIVIAATAACGGASSGTSASGVTSLRYQGWTDQVTPAELADALGFFNGRITLDWVGNTISGPQDIQSAATGQVDFGGAFAGAVAKLADAGAPITSVINEVGTDTKTFTGYYVLNSSTITNVAGLAGKKIGVNTLGGQDEANIHDALKQAGLSESQVRTVQLVPLPPPNIEEALRKGQIDAAALSGQFQQRAVAIGGVRPVFTDVGEYGPYNVGEYVFRNDFISKNPDAVRAFTGGVAKAIEWQRDTPRDQVIAEFTKIIDGRHRAGEDTSTLKYWLSVGVPTPYGLQSDADFTRWQSWLRDTGAIEGNLKPQTFYTNRFNPYATPATGAAPK